MNSRLLNTRPFMLVTALLIGTGLSSKVSAQNDLVADINQLKVAFVYNFSKYFTWPSETSQNHEGDFVICIDNPQVANGEFITLVGQLTQNRSIAIKNTPASTVDIMAQCHMWYVAAADYNNDRNKLGVLRTAPVLTVSDSPGSRNAGAVIELAVVNKKIQFRINNELMAQKNLNASAFLLRLAQ